MRRFACGVPALLVVAAAWFWLQSRDSKAGRKRSSIPTFLTAVVGCILAVAAIRCARELQGGTVDTPRQRVITTGALVITSLAVVVSAASAVTTGTRIDGLRAPAQYFQRLRRLAREAQGANAPPLYTVIEKILGEGEKFSGKVNFSEDEANGKEE